MKEQFIEIYTKYIKRPGADKLLEWLKTTDFFTAPASTRFHLSREGGLVEHSIGVFNRLKDLYYHEGLNEKNKQTDEEAMETIAICGLLHDVCKANFYGVEMRNKKNEQGFWEKVPFYIVDDKLPYGHGEKSVYIISGFMKLARDEAMAIRWHMGGFDEAVKGGSFALNGAFGMYPLAVLTHVADLLATSIDEAGTEEKK